jgi:hypothetical protein
LVFGVVEPCDSREDLYDPGEDVHLFLTTWLVVGSTSGVPEYGKDCAWVRKEGGGVMVSVMVMVWCVSFSYVESIFGNND